MTKRLAAWAALSLALLACDSLPESETVQPDNFFEYESKPLGTPSLLPYEMPIVPEAPASARAVPPTR